MKLTPHHPHAVQDLLPPSARGRAVRIPVSHGPAGIHRGRAQRVEMVAMGDKPITQRANERARVVIDGHRTDDGDLCSLVVVHERTGGWRLYPHGDNKLGVRLAQVDAARMARTILDGER